MRYHLYDELQRLVETKMATKRPHPTLPLFVYNYTPMAAFLPPAQWSDAMKDARGLILDADGEIVGRGFRKFWNYEQVLDQIPADEPYEIWEKVDGSLGIVCSYHGHAVVATRGSFESEQAQWAARRLANFIPEPGITYLFELVYPENRIVVDYGREEKTVLLARIDAHARFLPMGEWDWWPVAKKWGATNDVSLISTLLEWETHETFRGKEGFVIRFASGFQCKIKFEEYKRLHRLIYSCSTRTIWELLRSGAGITELVDRVPEDFKNWVIDQALKIQDARTDILLEVKRLFRDDAPTIDPSRPMRKVFAAWAVKQPNHSLLFSLLDGKDISDDVWRLVEPAWATPFKKESV